jgi:hypothetical protein
LLPIIIGRIVQGEGGALVCGHMRLAAPIAIFMARWMGLTLAAPVGEIPKYWRQHDVRGVIGVGVIPVFGAVLIGFGYYSERRKALRLLSDAFQSR